MTAGQQDGQPYSANGWPVLPPLPPGVSELQAEGLYGAWIRGQAPPMDPDMFAWVTARHEQDQLVRLVSDQMRARRARRITDSLMASADGMAPPQRMSMTLAEFLAGEDEAEIPFTVPGTLPVQCRLLLTGEEGRGKSTLIRWLCGCHAAGVHPWTGQPYEGGVSLLADAENPPALLRLRLIELAAYLERCVPGAQERILDRLIVESQPAGFDLSAPAWAEYLARIISDRQPGLVGGGPLYKLSSEPAKSEEFFETISGVLGRLQDRHGFSLLIEAHCRQPGPDGDRPEFPYGNTGWRRWPDMGYYLNARGELADWRGNRYGEQAPWPSRLQRVPGSNVAWNVAAGPKDGQARELTTADITAKIEEVRQAVTATPGINQTTLRQLVGGTGNQWIDAAVNARVIAVQRGGKGKPTLYYPAIDTNGQQGLAPVVDLMTVAQTADFSQNRRRR